MLVPREREVVLREREPVLRDDLAAPPPDEAFAPELDDDLRAPLERADPVSDDLAREDVDLRAPPLLEREPLDRDELERPPLDPRELLPRDDEVDEEEPELAPDPSSVAHFPDMTR